MTSIFTKIINREIPGHIIAETEDYIAFLDVFPLVHGHTLVVPKKEVDYIFDMEEAHYVGLQLFAQKISKAVKAAIPCKRIGVAVIGLEVPHAHIHLVPINQVGDINFTSPKLKPTQQELADVAAKIKAAL
jgi:histidine triad (HIT) family protein